MPIRLPSICVSILVVFFGCSSNTTKESLSAPAPSGPKSTLISDQNHSSGRYGFLWQPPMVPSPHNTAGGFNANILPSVRIDHIDPANNNKVLDTVVTFTTTGATPVTKQHIELHGQKLADDDADDDNTPGYSYWRVRWDTADFPNIKPVPDTYRITVLAYGLPIGYADTQLDLTNAQLKRVDTGNYAPLMYGHQMDIRFQLDTPAVDLDGDGVYDYIDNCPTVANGAAQATIANVGNQLDADNDGIGDACDACPDEKPNDQDHDTVCAGPRFLASYKQSDGTVVQTGMTRANDNCPTVYNLSQSDSLSSGIGDACRAPPTTLSGGGIVKITTPGSPILGASASFAAGTLPANAAVSINQLQAADVPPAVVVSSAAGPIIDIQGPPGLTFNPPVTVGVPFDPTKIPDLRSLVVYHFRTDTGAYESLPIINIDTLANVAYVATATLSPFFASGKVAVLVQSPTGFFVQNGQQTLNVSSSPLTISGQAGIPTNQGATTVRVVLRNAANGTFIIANSVVTAGASCDPSLISGPITSCVTFTGTVVLVTTAPGSFNQDIKLTAQPLNGTSAVGTAVTGDLWINLAPYPATPTNLTASSTVVNQINLSWTAGIGNPATNYTVQRSAVSGSGYSALTTTVPGTTTTYSDTNLGNGALYYYQVFATSSAGRSAVSNEALGSTPVPAPILTSAPATTSAITMNFASVSGATGYNILRSSTAGGPYAQVGTPGKNANSFTDSGLAAGTNYYYVAQTTSKNGSGASVTSSNSAEFAWATLANPVAGMTAAPSAATIVLSWPAQSQNGITGYTIYRSNRSGGAYASVGNAAANATSYTDAAGPGATFFYVITSNTISGPSVYSNEATATTIPAVITNLSAVATGTNINLTWSPTAGSTSTNIYRSLTAGGPYAPLATVTTGSYTDSTGTLGETYYYVVRAADATGESANSNESSDTVEPPQAAGLNAHAVGVSVKLSWTTTKGAKNYAVGRSLTAGGPYVTLFTTTGTTYTDSAVSAGGTYYYVVTASNNAGAKGISNEAAITLQPAAIIDLSAAAGAATSINLTWTAMAGATSYSVYRGSTAGTEGAVALGAPTSNSFNDATSTAGSTYFYVVTATNAGGTSANSNEATLVLKPAVISDLAAAVGSGTSVNLTWTAGAGATSYSVYRGSTAGGEGAVALGTPASNSFNDTTSTAGSTYYYVVTATNAGGTSNKSNEASLVLKPAVISDLAAAVGSGTSINLTWTAGAGATSYSVYRGSTAGGEGAVALGAPTSNSFNDATSTAGSTYFYVITATNAGGTSNKSNEASLVLKPAVIGDLAAAVGSGTSVNLTWTAKAGATSYSVYRGSTAGGEGAVALGAPTSNSFNDATSTAGSTYFYVVTATNAGGTSANSNEASIVLKPAAISDLAAAVGSGTSINLTWTAGAGATSYSVYRGSTAGGEGAVALGAPTSNSFNDATSTAGSTYYYVVTATNAGGTSANSNEASLVLKPAVIGDLAAAVGSGTSVNLTWTASAGATSYSVYRGSTAGGEGAVALGAPTSNSFNDATSTAGSTYFYVVTVTNAGGTSANSNEASITLKPAQLTGLVATVSGTTISLAWSATPGATSYNIFRGGASGAEAAAATATSSSASYSDAGLHAGAPYFYYVSATNAGGTGAVSSEVHGLTILAPPTNVSALVSVFDISLTWTASPDATSYTVLRSLAPDSAFEVMATVSSTSYCNCETGTNLRSPDVTYYYEIVANTVDASSVPSSVVSATTVFPAPGDLVVSNSASTTGSGRTTLLVAWNSVAGATSYSLQRALAPSGKFNEIASLVIPGYTDSGLEFSTTYSYRVVALSPTGPGPASAPVNGTTLVSPWLPGVGLSGGDVMAVAFDPSNASIAYAAVRGGAGVFKSTDGGATWSASGSGLGASSVASLAFSAGKLFAGTIGAGIYVSADGASTWTSASSGLIATDSYVALASDPAGSGKMYAASASHLFASADNGATWLSSTFTPGAPLTAIAIDPNSATTLFAATDGAGVYRSVDSGANWSVLGFAGQSVQGGLLVDPANSRHVWLGTAAGVQVSSDAGATWTAAGALSQVRSLALSGGTLFASSNGAGVYRSVDAGNSWTAMAGSPAMTSGVVAMAASGSQLLAAAYGGAGVFASADTGSTWTASIGLSAADTTALAMSPSNPAVLYAVAGYGLSKSVDHGATWAASSGLAYPVVATAVAVDPGNPAIVYVGAHGVQRSTDGGGSFTSTGANFVPSALAIPSSAPSTVYAAVFNGGIYVADFSAATPTWTQRNTGLSDLRIHSVAVDPANAQNVFAGGDGGFYRSVDGARTWTSSGLTFVRSITVAAGRVFAVVGDGTASNLQVSVDGGATFTAMGFGTTAVQNIVSLAVEPTTGKVLYAIGTSSNGSAGGLYKSADSGGTWNVIKPGLSSTRLHGLIIDPSAGGSLFLATQDNGIQLSLSGGE
jgi:fibronectin type 3 domain-containing protein